MVQSLQCMHVLAWASGALAMILCQVMAAWPCRPSGVEAMGGGACWVAVDCLKSGRDAAATPAHGGCCTTAAWLHGMARVVHSYSSSSPGSTQPMPCLSMGRHASPSKHDLLACSPAAHLLVEQVDCQLQLLCKAWAGPGRRPGSMGRV